MLSTATQVRHRLRILAMMAALALSVDDTLAAGNVFTVGNYPVEAEAANAVAAKEKAVADGQEAAFRSLLKRIVPVGAYRQLDRLRSLKAAEILDGVSVGSEQNSATRYIASLDFSFQADAVRATLSREGIPFVEEQAPEIVLVPVRIEAKGEIKAATGHWASVWNGLDLKNTLTPVRVAALLPEVKPEMLTAALAGSGAADIAALYRTDRLVLAAAEHDAAGKRLNVTLAGFDAAGAMAWKRAYRINDNDLAYAEEFASVISLGVLEGRWKTVRSSPAAGSTVGPDPVSTGGQQDIVITVQFANGDEWADLRGRLLEIDGTDDLRVGTVGPTAANVTVKFPGGGPGLASALAGSGAILTPGAGGWIMRSGL